MSLKNYTREYTCFQHPFMGYISPNCDHHCPTASSSLLPKLFPALHISVEAHFIPNCMKPVTEPHNGRLHLPGRCVSALQEGLPYRTTAGARRLRLPEPRSLQLALHSLWQPCSTMFLFELS